jgi:hypothetical protein
MSRFEDFQIQILHEICENSYKLGSLPAFNRGQVNQILPATKTSGPVYTALEALSKQGYLASFNETYYLTANGMLYIENGLADPKSPVSLALQQNTCAEMAQMVVPAASIPATDRAVTLDHNGDPYRDAIRALDEALAAFKEDHSFDNEWAAEKSALLQAIASGRALLERSTAHIATISVVIIEPVRTITGRYQNAIAEGIAKSSFEQLVHLGEKAIKAVLTLLGL